MKNSSICKINEPIELESKLEEYLQNWDVINNLFVNLWLGEVQTLSNHDITLYISTLRWYIKKNNFKWIDLKKLYNILESFYRAWYDRTELSYICWLVSFELKDYESALFYFNLCINKSSNYWWVYYWSALAYMWLKNYDEAERMAWSAFDLKNCWITISVLASTKFLKWELSKVEEFSKIWLQLSPDYHRNYINLALVSIRNKELEKAKKLLSNLSKINPIVVSKIVDHFENHTFEEVANYYPKDLFIYRLLILIVSWHKDLAKKFIEPIIQVLRKESEFSLLLTYCNA